MTTYSYPIAALFACTVVYGRLAADNEVTAVRAAGISLGPMGLGLPAVVLGVLVSILSLGMLSFIVPAATLQVERAVVSNIGQFVVNRIERQHQVRLYQTGSQPLTIFARSARVEPPEADSPNEQVVVLDNVSIITYARGDADSKLQVPDEFYVARQAKAYIRQPGADEADDKPVLLRASLVDGMKFPRSVVNRAEAAIQGGVRTQQFGPFPMRSPLRENTKFMDIRRLKELHAAPDKSRRMQELLETFIRTDQQLTFLTSLKSQLIDGSGMAQFKTTGTDAYTLLPAGQAPTLDGTRLLIGSTSTNGASVGAPVVAPSAVPGSGVQLIQRRKDAPSITTVAREASVRVFPDSAAKRIAVAIELLDAVVRVDGLESARDSFERSFSIDMPPALLKLTQLTASDYMARPDITAQQKLSLRRNLMKQDNSVVSEMHSRASFAVSCLVLTVVGYALGVMFKSGNYLNAFAVTVVPAIISVVLIVTGQHICENVPGDMPDNFKNPLKMGLIVIWSGNALVLGLAIVLLAKLRRT